MLLFGVKIHDCRGHITDESAETKSVIVVILDPQLRLDPVFSHVRCDVGTSDFVFKILKNIYIYGYFDPMHIVLCNKNEEFLGSPTDISAQIKQNY